MIALRSHGFGRRFGKTRITLHRLMILFDFPPFLVDRLDVGTPQGQVTRGEIKNALAAIFVCKDLLAKQKGEIYSLKPDFLHGVRF